MRKFESVHVCNKLNFANRKNRYKFTAISHTVSLTLGVLDCTPKQAERLSLRQGNSHIYPEDFLAQMLNDTLNSAKDMFSQKYAIDISDIESAQAELRACCWP